MKNFLKHKSIIIIIALVSSYAVSGMYIGAGYGGEFSAILFYITLIVAFFSTIFSIAILFQAIFYSKSSINIAEEKNVENIDVVNIPKTKSYFNIKNILLKSFYVILLLFIIAPVSLYIILSILNGIDNRKFLEREEEREKIEIININILKSKLIEEFKQPLTIQEVTQKYGRLLLHMNTGIILDIADCSKSEVPKVDIDELAKRIKDKVILAKIVEDRFAYSSYLFDNDINSTFGPAHIYLDEKLLDCTWLPNY